MVFACQRNSFTKTLVSKVKSCSKGQGNDEGFFEVICEDSIFFPEGGGQPWDTGFINDIPVHRVLRKGDEAVMYVEKPLDVGQEVQQKVDWERRFDHMQQHSGQHLITAIINREYKIETTSWWLGEKVSHIELDTKHLTQDQISQIESLANNKILEGIPVNVKLCEQGDEVLQDARTRGLPKDITGQIRIIEIVGLESDLCCGTHVSNLGQLQGIKLLHAEKGKKNKTNLFFICGGRVLKHLSECLSRESKLTKLLKNEPSFHGDLVEKLQQNVKLTNKKLNSILKQVAVYEGNKFKQITPQPLYYFHYNKDADSDYLDCLWREIRECEFIGNTFFFLAAGEESGNILLQGKQDDVLTLGPQVTEVLCGKGVPYGSRFQAKVSKLSNIKKAEEIIQKYFED